MSVQDVLVRIAEIQSGLVVPGAAPAPAASPAFSQMLQTAGGQAAGAASVPFSGSSLAGAPVPGSAMGAVPAGSGGAGVLAAVQGEVGQAEQPPGSNDSPRIAVYRNATAGSGVGPWCAYFTSWAARNAGMPLGDNGEGFGSVDALYAWAQKAGRAVPNGPGVVPRPGVLIVWDEHIGVVESIEPDGSIATIEGNSSDRVSRRVHEAGSALGYVRMG
ncbi:MAG TPA: CHAP domain-containing protein [Solirubrobacteraceae bacterium]|nr:CHAP domain-containing protein [Solirubrobacteraceae bacterium]